jgi:hypothetical protein
MRHVFMVLLLAGSALAQAPCIPAEDAVRIGEFYRLASQVQDKIWPEWGRVAAPLLLVTEHNEFLTHHPAPPKDFQPCGDGVYERQRTFAPGLLATFPAFGPPSVIVIGEPRNTSSKTSTPWLITVMHEHFHQLQNSQPDYYDQVKALGLSGGDSTGMWMLNYPFPYDKPEVVRAFSALRDLLLQTVTEPDNARAEIFGRQYIAERKKFFAQLSPEDGRYLNFQLWQEGIARYTQIKVAEAAEAYQPTAQFAALADFEKFSTYATQVRSDTLHELKQADLREWKRTVVYSFGAAEGLLLDRIRPNWKHEYFRHPLSMNSFLEN